MAIYVTKSFLPPLEQYTGLLKEIWERGILTNQGPVVLALEEKIRALLGVEHFHYLNNGTIALQIALHALGINQGEVITTPFSYVATTSSILWQRCEPVFVDIEPRSFTIDPAQIERAITDKTKAIMAVHVFGYPCRHEALQEIADRYNLKLIYDAAHAFGVKYRGKSLLAYGDISTLSFHATKLFHTIEGGGIVARDRDASEVVELAKRFGHNGDDHLTLGINAKGSEVHAAMGLVNLLHLPSILAERKRLSALYDESLEGLLVRPAETPELTEYNYAYYPVVFRDEAQLLRVFSVLKAHEIFPRRYFYPSLNTLPYVARQSCPVSEDIALRIACLPLYVGLLEEEVRRIAHLVKSAL